MMDQHSINSSTTSKYSLSYHFYREKFGYESTYNEKFYTTELDESKYTKEQIRKATQLEREIEEKKRNKGTGYDEDSQEKMDNIRKILDKSADNFYKMRKDEIISFEEIEKRQLTFTKDSKQNSTPIQKELSQDDMIKKTSFKSINEYDIDGVDVEQDNNYEIEGAVSEGSDADASSKSGMKLSSSVFKPKKSTLQGSNKSVDEFDITDGDKPVESPHNDAEKGKLRPVIF